MAKWLLMAQDRLETTRFRITQEFLATLLGATRPTVTGVANSLQRKHAIDYSRGRLDILDRAALEAASCECYRVSTQLLRQVTNAAPAAPAR